MKTLKHILVLSLALCLAPYASAQNNQFLRSNPKFIESFREVVAKPSASTVRIVCEGKDTALGMIVDPDGWVLTKANDLKGKVAVKLKDGRELEATVVGLHKDHDLAMLKIDAKDLVPVVFTPSKGLDAGNWVACAGLTETPVAIGVISVSTRNVINKGPTFTIDNTKAGFLGVSLEPAKLGVRINRIEPKSAAEKSGLKVDDVVLSLQGKNIGEVENFILEMAKHKPGDVVTLKVRRESEDLEIKATLGKRPPGMMRGDFQNKMGSELSTRRSGYPTILQHDSVVKPTDCGGPIVDLDGRVIGINICRAGRTESWAVPSEVVQTVMADLKSGKLAPPPPDIDAVPKVEEKKQLSSADKKELGRDVDELLGLMKKRLDLAADVARFKYVNKLPIADGKREERLLAKLLEAAETTSLDAELTRSFFNAQLAASKQLQDDLHARWTKDNKSLAAGDVAELKRVLRPKIDQVSLDLVATLAKLQPHLKDSAARQLVRDRAAQVLQGDSLSDAIRAKALETWLQK